MKGQGHGAKLFPNPASGHTYLVLDVPITDAFVYRLLDGLGRVVLERTIATGGQVFEVDLGQLADGAYACEITLGGGLTETLQLVIKH